MWCSCCAPTGEVCLNVTINILSEADVRRPEIVKTIRAGLCALPVSAPQIPHFLIDVYRDFRGVVANDNGHEEWLDTEAINPDCPAVIAFFKRQRSLGAKAGYFERASYPRVIVAGTILNITQQAPHTYDRLVAKVRRSVANDNAPPKS